MKNFSIPQGFQIPDGVEPGQTFETVATVTLGKDGMLSLAALDGAAIETEEPKDDKSAKAETSAQANPDFVQSVMDEMGAA